METDTENKFLKFLNKHSKKFIIGSIIVAVLAVAAMGGLWASFKAYESSEVIAYVGKDKITKKDFRKLSYVILREGTPEAPEYPSEDTASVKNSILDTAIEMILVKNQASEYGLSVSEKEAEESVKEKDIYFTSADYGKEDIIKYEKYLLEKEKLVEKLGGNKFGTIIVAREDVYYPESGELNAELEAKIDDNYKYSENFINDLYTKLKNGALALADAVDLENKDAKIGEAANPLVQTFHSGKFTAEDYRLRTGLIGHPEVLQAINSLKAGEISEPIHVVSSEKVVGDYANIGWFLVGLDEESGDAGTTYDEWLLAEKNEVGVKILKDVTTF